MQLCDVTWPSAGSIRSTGAAEWSANLWHRLLAPDKHKQLDLGHSGQSQTARHALQQLGQHSALEVGHMPPGVQQPAPDFWWRLRPFEGHRGKPAPHPELSNVPGEQHPKLKSPHWPGVQVIGWAPSLACSSRASTPCLCSIRLQSCSPGPMRMVEACAWLAVEAWLCYRDTCSSARFWPTWRRAPPVRSETAAAPGRPAGLYPGPLGAASRTGPGSGRPALQQAAQRPLCDSVSSPVPQCLAHTQLTRCGC